MISLLEIYLISLYYYKRSDEKSICFWFLSKLKDFPLVSYIHGNTERFHEQNIRIFTSFL